MPHKPLGLCSAPGCPVRVRSGRCTKHQRDQDAQPFAEIYHSARWRAIRKVVLNAQPYCSCGRKAEQIDHIVALRDGGAPFDRMNLQALCLWCHQAKTARDSKARRGARV